MLQGAEVEKSSLEQADHFLALPGGEPGGADQPPLLVHQPVDGESAARRYAQQGLVHRPADVRAAVNSLDAGDPPTQALRCVWVLLRRGQVLLTCGIDGVLEHSPADCVRRPACPPKSATLGFSHLQFEARLTAPAISPFL